MSLRAAQKLSLKKTTPELMPSEIKPLNPVEQHVHTTQHVEQMGKILPLNAEARNAIAPNLWDLHQKCSVRFNQISQFIQTTLRSSYVLHPNLPALSLAKLSSAMTVKWAVATATTALVAIVAAPRIYNASPELLKNLPFFNRIEESAPFIPQDVLSGALPDEIPAFEGTQTAATPWPFEFIRNAIPTNFPLTLLSLEPRDEKNFQLLNPTPNSHAVPPPPFETRVELPSSNPNSSQVVSTDSTILDFSSRTVAYLASITAAAALLGFRGQLNRQMPQIKQISIKVQKEMNRLLAPGNRSIKHFLKKIGGIGGAFSALLSSTEPQPRPHPHQPPSMHSDTRGTAAFSMRQDPKAVQNFNQLRTPLSFGESSSSSSKNSKGKEPAQQKEGKKWGSSKSGPSAVHSLPPVKNNSDSAYHSQLPPPSQRQRKDAKGQNADPWVTPRKRNSSRQRVATQPVQDSTSNYWSPLTAPANPKPPPLPPKLPSRLPDTINQGSSSSHNGQVKIGAQGSFSASISEGKNGLRKTHPQGGSPRQLSQQNHQASTVLANPKMLARAKANGLILPANPDNRKKDNSDWDDLNLSLIDSSERDTNGEPPSTK